MCQGKFVGWVTGVRIIMRIDILTLFPNMFNDFLETSIIGRAITNRLLTIVVWNIRDFAKDKHRIVDDSPYGGGPGMVLKPEVVVACLEHVKQNNTGKVIYLSPQGKTFNQGYAKQLGQQRNLVILCGHYEGLDERVRSQWIDCELSIGDYVLTGGELPAMVIVDVLARMIPGVLGDHESYKSDSHYCGLLEHPQYTRPAQFRNLRVPEVLLSGNHELIRKWRLKESLKRTLLRRPDLIDDRRLTSEEKQMLIELEDENKE